MCVISIWSQVALLIVTIQDARKNIGTVCLIMECRFGGEDQQVGAVFPPTNLSLWKWETSYTVAVSYRLQYCKCQAFFTSVYQINFLKIDSQDLADSSL